MTVYQEQSGPYTLHRRTKNGVYHEMGVFETDYVEIAFRDCVADHNGNYIWVTSGEGITLEQYDPDHDDYLDY